MSWRDPLQRIALLAGAASLGCLALLAGPPYFSTASAPQRWTSDPGLEVQTVTDIEDLRLTLGDVPSQDRETMRVKVQIDFAFVMSYVALLVSLGTLLARRRGWRRAAGIASVLCALAIAASDILENAAILRILNVPIAQTTEAMLDAIRNPAAAKWRLLLVYALLLLCHYESTPRNPVSSSVRPDPR